MKAQNKAQAVCDVSVYSDKGSLALRFPKRHSALWEMLDGKSLKGKPKCLGIGKYGYSDTPEDWKRASQLAIALEADLDHPEWEKLFDPTLAKYGLGGGKYAKLADVLQMPGTVQAEPEITVGQMWEEYLEWKKTVVEETTFKARYGTMTNAINGKVWVEGAQKFVPVEAPLCCYPLNQESVIKKSFAEIAIANKSHLKNSLAEAFEYCKERGILVDRATENPFLFDKFSIPTVTTQQKYANKVVNGEEKEWHEVTDEKELEGDRRAFTKQESDIIIEAFYKSSGRSRQYAPLIEFYFLTGCRTSEALPLTWKDVDFDRNIIRFSKSIGANTRKVKETKTGETRLFYFSAKSRLKELLLGLKQKSSNSLIFPSKNGGYVSYDCIRRAWSIRVSKQKLVDGSNVEYRYLGVVAKLVEEGLIGTYLSPYHTRHTYITLTAHANAHNNNALLHIATSCGNSVDVILRHYLGVSESVQIVEAW